MSTPNDIEILIHCYTCPAPHPRIEAGAVQETIKRFVSDGIIEQCGEEFYHTTEKGKAWLESILQVPYPTRAWVDKDNNIIESI